MGRFIDSSWRQNQIQGLIVPKVTMKDEQDDFQLLCCDSPPPDEPTPSFLTGNGAKSAPHKAYLQGRDRPDLQPSKGKTVSENDKNATGFPLAPILSSLRTTAVLALRPQTNAPITRKHRSTLGWLCQVVHPRLHAPLHVAKRCAGAARPGNASNPLQSGLSSIAECTRQKGRINWRKRLADLGEEPMCHCALENASIRHFCWLELE